MTILVRDANRPVMEVQFSFEMHASSRVPVSDTAAGVRNASLASLLSNQRDLVSLRVMTDIDPAKFRRQADECQEQANNAINPVDQLMWLRLAEGLIKLADGMEQARRLRDRMH